MRRVLLLLMLAPFAPALPRDPAVSRTHIAFIEAGQVWVVPRAGGAATRVTNVDGGKSSPRFSGDGERIAYASGDLYVVPVKGGTPERVTYLPGPQTLCQWTEDDRLLFFTRALTFSPIETQLFTVPSRGGLPTQLPLRYGSDGGVDPTETWLAYTPQWPTPLISNWVGYRGGAAPDLWLFNVANRSSRKLTSWQGSDVNPMWRGTTLYYVSDEGDGLRRNIWAYDTVSGRRHQVTHFRDYEVRRASIGPDAIVFEHGPDIQLLDLSSEAASVVPIRMPAAQLVRDVDASAFITFAQAAGGNVLVEARGDLWIAPAGGAPRNITATSSAFEREASLRPDGRAVAYWSDATGEYQLYVRDLNDSKATALTHYASGFRYRPVWSPDGTHLAFCEQTGAIDVLDVATGTIEKADEERWNAGIQPTELAWSADSTWLAYTKTSSNRLMRIWRYDLQSHARVPLTSEMFYSSSPAFDKTGEHFFFVSERDFENATFDWIQQRVANRNLSTLIDVPLRGTAFDAASFESAARRLPIAKGSIGALSVSDEGNPMYGIVDVAGKASVRVYDLRSGTERVVIDDTMDVDANATKIDRSHMSVRVDLRAEWRELFDDAWRLYRDFFFAPGAPKIDWDAVKARYAPMIERSTSRDDVNRALAAMIGESRAGHAYLGRPGDIPASRPSDVASLGVDLAVERGAFRIARVVRPAPWDDTVAVPLRGVREGEYLLAINGRKPDVARDPRAMLLGLGGKEVEVTVGPNPSIDASSRTLRVTPLRSENKLREHAWIERNRQHVDERSGGRIGYVHVPDFTTTGFAELARQFYGQIEKDALIIDARWSQGGSTGAIVAELLARPRLNAAAGRYNEPWPAVRYGAHFGPKALLASHMTVSAGENFSYYFRKLGLGPVIGERTWGGLTGLNGVPALIDGGSINVPAAPFFDETGWLLEGRGLEPDVAIEDDPAANEDAQLDAAIAALLAQIKTPASAR